MNTPACRRRHGFTLVELLVVTLILGGVAAAIGACVAAGVRVLDSVQEFSRHEARAQLGLGLLERDVRNSFTFYAIPFEADDSALAFPGLVDAHDADRRIGTVSYEWDKGREAFVRRRWSFPPAERPYDARGEDVIVGVRRLRLSYLARSGGFDEAEWAPVWQSVSNRPVAVRIEVELVTGKRVLNVSRTIRLRGGTGEAD